jgi:hypothetical protein|nr:MAG TPA: hypothetical protein [Caudoviricetes sp.]
MTEKEKKEMEYIAYDWLNEGEFPVNDNYEIEYSEEQLNNFLSELKEDGYSEEEITHFKDCVENFSEEREEEIFDSIPYEEEGGGIDWYEENYRTEIITYTSKKIA